MDIDYEAITYYTLEALINDKAVLKYSKVLKKLSCRLIEQVDIESEYKSFSRVSYEESEEIAKKFLAFYSKDLLDSYLNIRARADKVYFFSVEGENEKIRRAIKDLSRQYVKGEIKKDLYKQMLKYYNYSFIDGDDSAILASGDAYIFLRETLQDSYVLVHEFMHLIFWQDYKMECKFYRIHNSGSSRDKA